MSVDRVVVKDSRLDADRFILDRIDTTKGPLFKVSQVGEMFFARTAFWVRWLEREHRLVIDGDPKCRHFQPGTRLTEQVVDGKLIEKETKTEDSWLVDGVCSKCGGRAVGTDKTETGSRVYTLTDIEQMTHALAGNGAITGAQAHNALLLGQTLARIHGYIA